MILIHSIYKFYILDKPLSLYTEVTLMIISHNSFIMIADLFFKLLHNEVLYFGLCATLSRERVIRVQVTAEKREESEFME